MPTPTPHNLTADHLVIHTDGGSRGNPGPAATGVVIYDSTGKLIHSFGTSIGIATNNVAEYTAVLHALNYLSTCLAGGRTQLPDHPTTPLIFKLDSKLVVEQLSGRWKIKDPNLAVLANQIQDLASRLHLQTSFFHIPRSQNAAADAQVNLALDSASLLQ